MGYSAWAENCFDALHYLPKKGPNAGLPTSIYKTTARGNVVTRFGKPVPRSLNAVSKIRLAKWVKIGGGALNFAGIGFTVYDIINKKEFTIEHGFDLAFGGVAFIPVWGWAVSGLYFLGKEAFSDMPHIIEPTRNFKDPYTCPIDNLNVVTPNYEHILQLPIR